MAALTRVRFTADHDHTPDHRTIAYRAGMELDVADLLEPFAADNLEELKAAFLAYGVPAEFIPENAEASAAAAD